MLMSMGLKKICLLKESYRTKKVSFFLKSYTFSVLLNDCEIVH